MQGHFWHLRYPIIDPRPGEPAWVVVATTRPETMLGDTAVAVHPDPEVALSQRITMLKQDLIGASEKKRPGLLAKLDELEERQRLILPGLVQLRKYGPRWSDGAAAAVAAAHTPHLRRMGLARAGVGLRQDHSGS